MYFFCRNDKFLEISGDRSSNRQESQILNLFKGQSSVRSNLRENESPDDLNFLVSNSVDESFVPNSHLLLDESYNEISNVKVVPNADISNLLDNGYNDVNYFISNPRDDTGNGTRPNLSNLPEVEGYSKHSSLISNPNDEFNFDISSDISNLKHESSQGHELGHLYLKDESYHDDRDTNSLDSIMSNWDF